MDREGGALVGVWGFNLTHLGQRGDELGLRSEQQACELACHIVRQGGAGHEPERHRERRHALGRPWWGCPQGPGRDFGLLQRRKAFRNGLSGLDLQDVWCPLARFGHGGHHISEWTGAGRTYREQRGNALLTERRSDLAVGQHHTTDRVRRDLVVRHYL